MARLSENERKNILIKLLLLLHTVKFSPVSQASVLFALYLLAEILKNYFYKVPSEGIAITGALAVKESTASVELQHIVDIRNTIVHGNSRSDINAIDDAFESTDDVIHILNERNIPQDVINLYMFCSIYKQYIYDMFNLVAKH